MKPTPQQRLAALTVNEITQRWPETLPILHGLGLDLCCGGWMPLERAVSEAGLELDGVLPALARVVDAGAGAGEAGQGG